MPRTRSSKVVILEQSPPGEEADDNASPLPPLKSFQGQLTKYEYTATSDALKDGTTAEAPTRRTNKRTHTGDVAVAGSNQALPQKRSKSSQYAPPSKYAHLSPLVDILEPNLIGVFCGFNPGVKTSSAGHAYAHSSNHFWKLLHSSGLTDRRLKPEEDRSLPALYCMGNTNIVSRPSKNTAELTKEEMSNGTADLDAKFLEFKPESVCIVGKSIWEAIWRYRHGRKMKNTEFMYGWQDERHNMGKSRDGEEKDVEGNVWKGTKVFVATATSGLAASLKPAEKEAIWKPYGEWVQQRRTERGFVPRGVDDNDDKQDQDDM